MPSRRIVSLSVRLAALSAALLALSAGPAWAPSYDTKVDVNALAGGPSPQAPLLPPAIQNPRPSQKMQQAAPPVGGQQVNQPMMLKVNPAKPPAGFEGKYLMKGATHNMSLGHPPDPGKFHPPSPAKSFPPDPIANPLGATPPEPAADSPKAMSGEGLSEAIKSAESQQEAARNKSQQTKTQFQNADEKANQNAQQLSTILKNMHEVHDVGGSSHGLGD